MTNDETMTLNLRRINMCDVMLAITGIVTDMKHEMNNDPACSEYRKTIVLPASIKKWEKLRDEIKRQFEAQDKEEI